MRQWRLIYDCPTPGPLNMAIDEALLGCEVPTLRLYAWSIPCLSLGYGQRARVADRERLNELNWDIVRRPTGGRAILHADELTYSLSLPVDHRVAAGGIVESYRRISGALLAGLARLGVTSQADLQSGNIDNTNAVCFETPSHYEITVDHKKLIGSAQIRRKQGILQHGSLPLAGSISRICDVLIYADADERKRAKEDVALRATTLGEMLHPQIITWDEAARAIIAGFEETFAIELCQSELSNQEKQEASRLHAEVYAHPDWTFRR